MAGVLSLAVPAGFSGTCSGTVKGAQFRVIHSEVPMHATNRSFGLSQAVVYFGLLSLLVNLVNPTFLLDIPTSYMLKNILQLSPSQIAIFRLLTAVPFFLGFVFGLVRDLWNPLGRRDLGYFRIFVPLMVAILALMAYSPVTYLGLFAGMLMVAVAHSFLAAAAQGLTALVGQETQMTGRLSALSCFFLFLPGSAAYFASGFMSESMTPRDVFLMVLALTATLAIFGYWKPHTVFHHAYDDPRAQSTTFFADMRRLVRHRAIYPVVLINLLWNFTPGAYTPMQFYLTNQLHAPDSTYGYFLGILGLSFLPTVVLYGVLCQKFPPRKLLLWSLIIGVPQFLPMAFIHNGQQALLAAVIIGLMGGMANAACIDIAMRACPAGLQGTLMMMIAATFSLSMRGGDVFGTWIYGLSPENGFLYCVIAITMTYALILPLVPLLPKEITATADGEPNPEQDSSVVNGIGMADV